MKRYIALLACIFALSACGNQSGSGNANSNAGGSANDSTSASTQSSKSGSSSDHSGDFKNDSEKRSYALGMDIGNSLKQLPIKLDVNQLTQGLRDVVSGGKTRLTDKQLKGVMQDVVSNMKTAQKKKTDEQAQANLKQGKAFLAANKKKDGVKTLPDGLQYKVIKPGTGPSPDANDSVTVDYVGKLPDGTVFDSSKAHGKSATFPVNAVIPGWTEALQLMKQGAEYKLFIPPSLAYGERGAGSKIGPNQTLVFDVHLIKVDKKKGDGSQDDSSSSQDGSDQSQSQNGDAGGASDAGDAGQSKGDSAQ